MASSSERPQKVLGISWAGANDMVCRRQLVVADLLAGSKKLVSWLPPDMILGILAEGLFCRADRS